MEQLKVYLDYIKKNRKTYILVMYLITISTIVGLSYTLMLKVVIDDVLINRKYNILLNILMIILLSFLINSIINYSNGVFVLNVNQRISISLKRKILNHVQLSKNNEYSEYDSGDLLNRTKNDIDVIAQFLSTSLLSLITNISSIIIYSILMFYINRKLAILAILLSVTQLTVSRKFSKKIKDVNKRQKEQDSNYIDFLSHVYTHNIFYKIFNKAEYNNNRFNEILSKVKDIMFEYFRIKYIFNTSISFISYIASIILIGVGIYEIIMGRMTIGILFVFDSVSEKFYQYSNAIMNFNLEFQNAYVSMERVNELTNMELENYSTKNICSEEHNKLANTSITEITIGNGMFKYTDKYILKDIFLTFEKKKCYVIMGPSGQGKTTLANIIVRLYDLNNGDLCINKLNIKSISVDEIRDKITYVIQKNIILNGTIRENLLLGNNSISNEEFKYICKICYIDEFTTGFTDGYNTIIGDKGVQLSEGQKQRISIARGLLRTSDVYIFDEITSNLDKELGLRIIENIQNYLGDKIQVYITHDPLIQEHIKHVITVGNSYIEMKN